MDHLPKLESLRNNDPLAWNRLYASLSPVATKSARAQMIGYPQADVEEVASQAMQKLVEKVRVVEETASLAKMIWEIAKCTAIDHLRVAGAKKRGHALQASLERMYEETGDAGLPTGGDATRNGVMLAERREGLNRALLRIKPGTVELLVGFYIHGMTYGEIAKTYGMALGSVGPALYRAVQRLRAEIDSDPRLAEALAPLGRVLALLIGLHLLPRS